MTRKYLMSWKPKERRWRKLYRGVPYTVSCRQLGTPETKEGSWWAANEWFKRERDKATAQPSQGDAVARSDRVRELGRVFDSLDEEGRRKAVDMLLGKGAYQRVKSQHDETVASVSIATPDKTIECHVKSWVQLLHGACLAGQLSVSRYHGYSRDILTFTEWVPPGTGIDQINAAMVEDFFSHLSAKIAAKQLAPVTAHIRFATAKQFISWLAERGGIVAPTNMKSKRLRFNHGRAAKIETFTAEEVREILAACGESEERMKLYMLLMCGTGMYQSDVADLRQDEVDWEKGLIARARSKTKDHGGLVIRYKLWPETFELLKKYRAKEGPLVLLDEQGRPIVERWVEDGKMKRRDSIDPAWRRVSRSMGIATQRLGMMHLRKTSASILAEHAHYKYYASHFLSHSPKGMTDRHYVKPSEPEFFAALDWLRIQILGPESS